MNITGTSHANHTASATRAANKFIGIEMSFGLRNEGKSATKLVFHFLPNPGMTAGAERSDGDLQPGRRGCHRHGNPCD